MLTKFRSSIAKTATKIAKALARVGFTPNTLTILGLLFSIISAYFYYQGFFILGGLMIVLVGVFDILDGALARVTNTVSEVGGIFDSTVDRYADLFILFGIFLYYASDTMKILYVSLRYWIILAIIGTIMVSYVRARVEATGKIKKFEVGLMERSDRYLLLAIGSAFAPFFDVALPYTLCILAVLTNITVFQRCYHLPVP